MSGDQMKHDDAPLDVVLRNLADKVALLNQLRKCDSFGEVMLAVALWRSRDGWTLVTQGGFDGYRVDIVIPEAKLCIEVDGAVAHGTVTQQEHDVLRQAEIEARGWLFLRVTAADAFLRAGECSIPIIETVRNILSRPAPTTLEEVVAADLARTEHAIANFEAHLSMVDLGDLETRRANEERLRRLRLRLENLKDQQAMATGPRTVEEEEAFMRRVQDRAIARRGGKAAA